MFLNITILILLLYYILRSLNTILKTTFDNALKIYYVLILIFHFCSSIGYILVNKYIGQDTIGYFNGALNTGNWLELFDVGRTIISFFIFPLVKIGISMPVIFLFFSTISFKGFLILFELIEVKTVAKYNWYLLMLFLLPSIHFWTGSIGKEAILFFLLVFLLKKIKSKLFDGYFIIAFVTIYVIRPHLFFFLLLSFILVIFFEKGISKRLKRKLIITSMLIGIIFSPIFFIYFLKVEEISFISIKDYLDEFLKFTESVAGNSSISISETTLFSRILIILFVPLPFLSDIKNVFQFVVAIENVYVLLVVIYSVFFILKNKIYTKKFSIDLRFTIISFVLLVLLFGLYVYNLGLASRMRVMFYPYLFYFLFFTLNIKYQLNEKVD